MTQPNSPDPTAFGDPPIQPPADGTKPSALGSPAKQPPMMVVNTESLPGYDIKRIHGIVQGNTVRAKHAGRDIAAGLKNIVGGELRGYTELLTESRREAFQRMIDQAAQMGANAVLNVRFTTSAITAGAADMYAYGTAVYVEPSMRPEGEVTEALRAEPEPETR